MGWKPDSNSNSHSLFPRYHTDELQQQQQSSLCGSPAGCWGTVHVDPATLDSRSLGKYYLVWVLIPAVTERWLDQNLVWTWKQIFILSHTALAVRLLTIKNSSSSWRKRLNSSTSKMYLIRWMVNVTFNSNGLQASSFTFLMFDVMWT